MTFDNDDLAIICDPKYRIMIKHSRGKTFTFRVEIVIHGKTFGCRCILLIDKAIANSWEKIHD